jgi:hypothetical protein
VSDVIVVERKLADIEEALREAREMDQRQLESDRRSSATRHIGP